MRKVSLILWCLLAVVGAWFFWPRGSRLPVAQNSSTAPAPVAVAKNNSPAPATAPVVADAGKLSAAATNRLTFRLANTPKSIAELKGERHAILLENAFIDTAAKMDLKIPSHLQAKGEPGAYLVQARGASDGAFRAALAAAGGNIISYIPNNAFLVEISSAGAAALSASDLVQAVLPYEPYYKVQASLLGLAVNQQPLPPGTYLTLGLFADSATATLAQIEGLGGKVLSSDRSPFGQIVRINPPADWIALADLPGVMRVEPAHLRKAANDLSRPATGVAADSTNAANYLNLTGSNVLVEVNDTGIDTNHPDLQGRVGIDVTQSGVDTDGHGTHVAGIIAGSGLESTTVTNARGSINPGILGQYRGKAPLAKLFSINFLGANATNPTVDYSDSTLQEIPALTNALISNNSWVNDGDNEYDLSAASYDWAARDALPPVTGPQPVLFVFAAGNDGSGNSDGSGGSADTISSPGTAKNVLTVGALEQFRNITNIVTALDGTSNAVWQPETDSSFQVADYSARGNVGVETEGSFGRFKPDVVAPGTFVVSTRSTVWDQLAYYDITNYHAQTMTGQLVTSNTYANGGVTVPQNAVGVVIEIENEVPGGVNLPIYVSSSGVPDPTDPTTYDFVGTNIVNIPPDGPAGYMSTILNGGVSFTIGGSSVPVTFDVLTEVITTNDLGNELTVLSNLNNSISGASPYYYRYETGTSMASASVSGVLALMQDFFTNTLHLTPSPALLKAMVVNGARVTGNYNFAVANTINLQGWGQLKLSNSIPAALTNAAAAQTNSPIFFVDQSPTNVVATGDRRTYLVSVPSAAARALPLRVTLAWTDPPGNPAAAIKLVNDLELVVTNISNGQVFYANNFSVSGTPPYSLASASNAPPAYDSINNVQNIYLSPTLGTNYSVTVVGNAVNVNAVTANQTNIVQDFALVIANGDGNNPNGITVTAAPPAPSSANAQRVTYVSPTNSIYFNQTAGADAPWLSTNGVSLAGNPAFATNSMFYVGQTNQWHFYIVTNTFAATNSAYQYAGFIVFLPNTLSLPREGVFAGSDANSTRPEADLELFAATAPDALAPQLTNLNQMVIAECLTNVSNTDEASYGRGGTEFVTFSNSVGNQVYYIGVQCDDQTAGQFGFVPLFSNNPFSSTDTNGNIYVNAVNVPNNIPDGNNAHPGVSYVFALAVPPDPSTTIRNVTVTNTITHQNFGDLLGALSHGSTYAVLNNHDGLGPVVNDALVYDDSGQGEVPGALHTDGPGSLMNFQGTLALGPWILNEIDDSPGSTGTVMNLQLRIEPHRDLGKQPGVIVSVPAGGWYYDYVIVPVGYTNLVVNATNLAPNSVPPIQLYVKLGSEPTQADTNDMVLLTNCVFGTYPTGVNPGNSESIGPPLTPGIYYIGIFNPDTVAHSVLVGDVLSFNASAETMVNFASTDTPLPLADDALTVSSLSLADYGLDNSTIDVTNTDLIQGINVGLRVDHPRISDMVFTLISPDDSRYLLMENRGGQTTNGCGVTLITTNIFNVSANGTAQPNTNYINTGATSGIFPITYNFYTAPDEMTVYYGTNVSPAYLIFDSGVTNNPPSGGGGAQNTTPETFSVTYGPTNGVTSTYLTIVMDQFPTNFSGGTNRSDRWTYTAGSVVTNYLYLTFTEDTNLTTTPIKFAPPPFVPQGYYSTNFTLSDFEVAAAGNYVAPATINDEFAWGVLANQSSVVADAVNAQAGSNFLALANGTISNSIPTIPGVQYTLNYYYRGPGIAGWWRGENNAKDSINGNNGILMNNGVNFAKGEVGTAFNLNGVNGYVLVNPTNTDLDVGQDNGFTIEGWVNPQTFSHNQPFVGYEKNLGTFSGSDVGINFYVYLVGTSGGLYANWKDTTGVDHSFSPSSVLVTTGVWQHVAFSYSKATGLGTIYLNGAVAGQQNLGVFTPQTSFTNFLIGGRTTFGSVASPSDKFSGGMDEISVYSRALSDSEVKAIYTAGAVGKFDAKEFTNSPALSLAEASVNIPGVATNSLIGDNLYWQQQTINFTATQTATPIVISGVEPGMLLDSFTVSGFNSPGLYYQPEQSLSPLVGTPANGYSGTGDWQLEALDNRAGATNPTPELLSWQLSFTFANTNFTIPTNNLINGIIQTNYAPAGSLTWYEIIVPTNAIAQTNTLVFGSLPLNLWFSTNQPPSTNSPVGTEELAGSTGGSVVVYTNGNLNSPLPMVPGGTNYIGVQNPNLFTAAYAISVNFELIFPPGASNGPALPFANTLPATGVTGTNAQLNGFATPNMTNGSSASAWFQWGANTSYGNITPAVNVGSGFGVVYVTGSISNLIFAQVYHCRLVVSNYLGIAYGVDEQFAPGNVVAWGEGALGQTNVPVGLSNVVAVAGGLSNSVALLNNGTVTNWGDNTYGQISAMPPGLNNVAAITAGGNDVFALLNNGTVVGWGANTGQTNIPAGLTNVVAVAAGLSNCVALLTNGTVVTWGDGSFGQTNVPVGLSNVVAIASGTNDVMALLNSGLVVSWGAFNGQTNVPASLSNVVAVAEGDGSHSLALLKDSTVRAWGALANGNTAVPPGLTNVVAIAAGFDDSLVLQNNGNVVAWGNNGSGQTSVPSGLGNVFAVACGAYHDLALTSEPPLFLPYANTMPASSVTGTNAQINGFATPNSTNGLPVMAWFQWGTSTNYANQTIPVSVGNGFNVVYVTNFISGLIYGQAYHYRIVVSNSISIAYGFDQLLVAGSTVAWGDNTYGQINVPLTTSNIVAIAAGGRHTLEVLTNGAVLAQGPNVQATVPANLGSNSVAIAGGYLHSLAVQSNGLVTAWGDNTFGQTNVPATLTNVVTVAAGGDASLALRNNGLVAAWGDNTFGQTNVPVGLSNVVAVADGAEHSLALLNNGTVVAWGTNTYGQATVPAGLNNVVAVAAGYYHSLALLNSGAVVAWGLNNAGQATVPAVCSSNVVAIAAGGYHSLALLNNGSIVVWGDNTLGQTNVPSSASNVVAVAAGEYHSVVLTSPYNINLNLFNYPTNPTNNPPLTNVVGAGGINWYEVNVPTNAIAASNELLSASLPVNLWYSTNVPPSITTPSDVELLTNASGGTNVIAISNTVPVLVPGGIYFLGVQNTNAVAVTNVIQVLFQYAPTPPILPVITNQFVIAGNTLVVTNNATDTNAGAVLVYYLTNSPNGAYITNVVTPTTTNAIIYWPTPTNLGPTNIVITTIVTDTFTLLSATNSFNVIVAAPLVNGQVQTNIVWPGGINWFAVTVPTNAIAATNALLSATSPVNFWYSTNVPPSIVPPADLELQTNVTSGTNEFNLTNTVPLLVAGETYYLGVQNTNAVAVTNAVQVTFAYALTPPILPVIPIQVVIAGDTLMVTNTATDIYTNDVLSYALAVAPTNAAIDTNGIIVWPTTTNTPATNYVFTTVVTDTNTLLSATNSFNVIVLPPLNNGQTNVVGSNSITWYGINVPTNAIAATNTLLFASAPVNLWWSTNVPPSITTTNDIVLLTNSINGTNVINVSNTVPLLVPGGVYYLGVQNTNGFAATNVLEVTFEYAQTPPVLPVIPDQVIAVGDTLVVTNTATDINANAGVLLYYLTNAPTGAYLTNDIFTNNIIVWATTTNTPATNYVFTTMVTDTNTLLSATNSFNVIVLPPLVVDQPVTNVTGSNSIQWYLVKVPANALAATNTLLFATAPVNLWFSTNVPPTITNSYDFELLTNLMVGDSVISTSTVPLLVPGSRYFLGVQNTNAFPVTNAVKVTFLLATNPPPIFSIYSIVNTNIGSTNGWMITWFAPTNYQFHLQWTPNLLLPNWHVFNGVISYLAPNSPTNALFQYFDNGARYYDNGSPVSNSPTDGIDPIRFYRLQYLNSPTNTPPYYLQITPTNRFLDPLVTLTVTNGAGDWDIPAQTLTYRIINSLPGTNGATINTNTGVIIWTPTLAQGGVTNRIKTVVTDNGVPAKSTTNSFDVYLNPIPPFGSIFINTNGLNLQWNAWTNEQFEIQWTTNLLPPVSWTLFPDIITSTNGAFTFVDTNAPFLMKFYQLILPP